MQFETGSNQAEALKAVPVEDLLDELKGRQLSAENIEKILEILDVHNNTATDIETMQATSIGNELEVGYFVDRILKKQLHAKLPSGSQAENLNIRIDIDHGFGDTLPDVITKADGDIAMIHQGGLTDAQDRYPELMQYNVVTVAPSLDTPGNMVLAYRFFQSRSQVDSRGWCLPAVAYFELEKSVMNALVDKLKAHPDFLEDLFQSVFKGLEKSRDDGPGLIRLKTNGFLLAEGDNLKVPSDMTHKSHMNLGERVFDKMPRFKYKNGPYGKGELFEPQ